MSPEAGPLSRLRTALGAPVPCPPGSPTLSPLPRVPSSPRPLSLSPSPAQGGDGDEPPAKTSAGRGGKRDKRLLSSAIESFKYVH